MEDSDNTIRIGYLRAALDRIAQGEFRSVDVIRSIAQSALDSDDTLAPARDG